MTDAHFPVLIAVVPLLSAPLIVLLRSRRAAFVIALSVCLACAAMAWSLLGRTAAHGVISYAIGSWPPPWGIEYRVDVLNAFVAVVVTAIAVLVIPYSRRSIAAELPSNQHYLFYALLMLCLAGLVGILVTGDVFNLFVFLEISSLSSYALIALGRDRRALLAGYQYLVMGTIGATFYIIGVGLLYLMTGTLNLDDLAQRLQPVQGSRPVMAALAFITVGIGLKLAMFPLHAWLPNAYAFAPSAVSAFLSATATKVSVYVLMRFYFYVFGPTLAIGQQAAATVITLLSVAAMVIPSVVAIMQRDLKRLLAYSSVAQIGYITLGIAMGTTQSVAASIVHVFNHALTKGALFMLAGGMAMRLGATGFDRLAGVGRTMPVTALAFVVGGLSLAGVPGTAGFVSKWYLVSAAIAEDRWWLVASILASSLLALVYVWRFVEAAYLTEPPADAPRPGEPPWSMLAPSLALAGSLVAFGVAASWSGGWATRIAQQLLEGTQ